MLRRVIAFGFAAVACAANAEEGAPRYRLQVGQELIYEGSSQFQYEHGSHGTTDRTTLWVTRENGDGSWHVVAHNESAFRQSFGKDEKLSGPEHKTEAFDAFDVFPDGRIGGLPEDYRGRHLARLFFKLPADAAARAGWEVEEEEGDKSVYRLAPANDPASGKWVFEKTEKGIMHEVYLSASQAVIHFDAARGLVTKVESESSQGYGFVGKGAGLTELKSATLKDSAWIAQLAQEADALAQAKAAVRDAYASLEEGAKPEDASAAAEKALRDGRQKVKLPVVDAQFEAQLAQLTESVKYFAERKKEEEEVLNKAAAQWGTTDLDGKKHALDDYRGKVIVLDFWYRGCGWCIKAMPQIKQVVDHFRDRPVAVLGMNTDRKEEDARFVTDKVKLNYPTLKAEGLPEKYKV
ncbi:MAG: TlpA family protein disulfide reductase, partial [Planctomycetes bacterium]|nr:TlpA family protein disulfide reductase [Planctomycetota bacterium]